MYRYHRCENDHQWQAKVQFAVTPNLSGEATAYCPTCGQRAQTSSPHVNWRNPWAEYITPVDLDSLAEAYNQHVADRGGMGDGKGGKIPNWDCRDGWMKYAPKEKLDAYILPNDHGEFSFGVRHSDEESAYYGMSLPAEMREKIKPLWGV